MQNILSLFLLRFNVTDNLIAFEHHLTGIFWKVKCAGQSKTDMFPRLSVSIFTVRIAYFQFLLHPCAFPYNTENICTAFVVTTGSDFVHVPRIIHSQIIIRFNQIWFSVGEQAVVKIATFPESNLKLISHFINKPKIVIHICTCRHGKTNFSHFTNFAVICNWKSH